MTSATQLNPHVILPQRFNEGANSTTTKVLGFVAALIASIASFFFLPAQGALLVSGASAVLFGLTCCLQRGEEPEPEGQRRWYYPMVNAMPTFFRTFFQRVQPVVNPGLRVPVQGRVEPYVEVQPNLPATNLRNQPHVAVNRGHRDLRDGGHLEARRNAEPQMSQGRHIPVNRGHNR